MAELVRTRIDRQGRIVIPAEVRERAGLKPGDVVTIAADETGLTLRTHQQAIRALQELARRHVPKGVSLADELIAERRAEAAREDE
jgi:AbrB family looped-hinge helix DNA binding protein